MGSSTTSADLVVPVLAEPRQVRVEPARLETLDEVLHDARVTWLGAEGEVLVEVGRGWVKTWTRSDDGAASYVVESPPGTVETIGNLILHPDTGEPSALAETAPGCEGEVTVREWIRDDDGLVSEERWWGRYQCELTWPSVTITFERDAEGRVIARHQTGQPAQSLEELWTYEWECAPSPSEL